MYSWSVSIYTHNRSPQKFLREEKPGITICKRTQIGKEKKEIRNFQKKTEM
jgi:hypothetical protein